jgi:MFS family permease
MIMLLAASLFAVRPMVTYRALELGASTSQIGLLAASYGMFSVLVAVPAGRWADRFGESRFMIAGAVLMGGMSLVLYLASSLLILAVSQAVLGAAHILGLVALQKMVAGGGEPSEREGRFGYFSVFASIGQVIGPGMGGFIAAASDGSARVVFLVSAGILVFAVINAVSLHLRPPPDMVRPSVGTGAPEGVFRSMARVLSVRSMPQAMAASITALVAIDLLVAYLPAYGEYHGIPVATIGVLLSIRAGASALSRISMVRIITHFGRKEIFIASLLGPAAAIVLMPFFPNVIILGVLMTIVGFGLGFGQPMSISFVAAAAPPEVRGMALGVRLSGNRVGQVILPALVGLVGGASGIGAVFFALSVLMVGTSAWLTTADFESAAGKH